MDIGKLKLEEGTTDAEKEVLLGLIIDSLKEIASSLEKLQETVHKLETEEVDNPYRPSSMHNVYGGNIEELVSTSEVSPLGWRKYKSMWLDEGNVLRTVVEYEEAHKSISTENEEDTPAQEDSTENEDAAEISEETANAQIVE